MTSPHPLYANMSREDIAQSMLSSTKELQTVFRQRASQAREIKKVPQESIDELHKLGFFQALQ